MRRLAIANGDAFILVYSVDSEDSFEEVQRIREAIIEERGGQQLPPIVVVGNKTDLGRERAVRRELAETIVTIDWENGFVECSAKCNDNVVGIFQALLAQARTPYLLSPKMVEKRRQALPQKFVKSAAAAGQNAPARPNGTQLNPVN